MPLRWPLDIKCEPFIFTECSEMTLGDRKIIVFLEYIWDQICQNSLEHMLQDKPIKTEHRKYKRWKKWGQKQNTNETQNQTENLWWALWHVALFTGLESIGSYQTLHGPVHNCQRSRCHRKSLTHQQRPALMIAVCLSMANTIMVPGTESLPPCLGLSQDGHLLRKPFSLQSQSEGPALEFGWIVWSHWVLRKYKSHWMRIRLLPQFLKQIWSKLIFLYGGVGWELHQKAG